jgi:thioredoxin-dependent peroxiredoxin
MGTTMRVAVGDLAPDFTLMGTDGTAGGRRDHTLSSYRGGPVVLVFYPADNSPVCTVQLTQYTNDVRDLEGVGARVLAISPQSIESHEAFAAKHGGFAFPLLADEGKSVGASYGILGPLGFYRRSIFVLDGEGVVRYAHRSVTSMTFQPVDRVAAAVREASEPRRP